MALKGIKGPRVSGYKGMKGFPMFIGAFKGLVFPKSNSSRVQGMKVFFQGSKAQGFKGKGLLGLHLSKGLKVQGP